MLVEVAVLVGFTDVGVCTGVTKTRAAANVDGGINDGDGTAVATGGATGAQAANTSITASIKSAFWQILTSRTSFVANKIMFGNR